MTRLVVLFVGYFFPLGALVFVSVFLSADPVEIVAAHHKVVVGLAGLGGVLTAWAWER